ncbi:aminoglycoside phosphotransferase [Betaproteobacteria bacterium GR16-43]|nr:aminoglycoside phosphotransferase [Betaproteobacteria bacterium GR16-43]
MENAAAEIDAGLARRLVRRQFPQWAHLPVTPVVPGGWDHRSFRLGSEFVVRMPSAAEYANQVEKEHRWLPHLAPSLPHPIPTPVAFGEPDAQYAWRWSIHRWIEGDVVAPDDVAGSSRFAADVADFLVALQGIDSADGPAPGAHNFHRGGSLANYDGETREAIRILGSTIDSRAVTDLWEAALRTEWARLPVWVHGDIAIGNLLVRNGRLAGVIDFGSMAVGDPACDLSMAWTVLRGEGRRAFRSRLPLDAGTWCRARAWTLWKGLILAARLSQTSAAEWANPRATLREVLEDA